MRSIRSRVVSLTISSGTLRGKVGACDTVREGGLTLESYCLGGQGARERSKLIFCPYQF